MIIRDFHFLGQIEFDGKEPVRSYSSKVVGK